MQKIKFIKEPGYTYGLFYLFAIYFNQQHFLKPQKGYKRGEEDCEYWTKMLDDCSDISKELLPFFYLKDENLIFMTDCYYRPYQKAFFEGKYNLSVVLTALSDYEQVIVNLLCFYFKNLTEKEARAQKDSLQFINQLIKESNYNSELKSALYAFFIDPVPVIQKLSYELMEKELQMSIFYEKNAEAIMALQNDFDEDKFYGSVQNKKSGWELSECAEVYVSIGMNLRQVIQTQFFDNKAIFIMGPDFEDVLEYCNADIMEVELDCFGTALSEKNRVDILDFIARTKEVSIKDVEKALGLTSNNAYYHLSLMIKARILKARYVGRTVLYSIDKESLGTICDTIRKYAY